MTVLSDLLKPAFPQKPSDGLVAVSAENIRVAKQLIEISRQLQDDGKPKLARQVLDQAAALLENNEQLQAVFAAIKEKID